LTIVYALMTDYVMSLFKDPFASLFGGAGGPGAGADFMSALSGAAPGGGPAPGGPGRPGGNRNGGGPPPPAGNAGGMDLMGALGAGPGAAGAGAAGAMAGMLNPMGPGRPFIPGRIFRTYYIIV